MKPLTDMKCSSQGRSHWTGRRITMHGRIELFLLLSFLIFDCQAGTQLPQTIETVKQSVVAVGTYLPKRSPRGMFLGTGFVVGDGTVVATNAHVIPETLDVEHLEELAVFVRRGEKVGVEKVAVLAEDRVHDVALLKLTSVRLPVLRLGKAGKVREGQLYAFTGFPIGMVLGLYPVTHRGIVSAITPIAIPMLNAGQLNEKVLTRLRDPYPVFQLDATAYPGNSGSPLYEIETGRVIGVINKVFIKESKENILSKPSGISYAVPIEYVQKLLAEKGLR